MLLYWVLGKNEDLEFGISIPVIFLLTLKKIVILLEIK